MTKIICATGNSHKFGIGQKSCAKFGIELEQVVIELDEIQGEEPDKIITRKAVDAYAQLQKPVVVTDDSWAIPGLGGFPGPYMKSINHWFTAEDFLRLTKDLADRRILIQQYVAYHDGLETVIFSHDVPGQILDKPRGDDGPPIMKIVALDNDNGLSLAQAYDQTKSGLTSTDNAWHAFASWFNKKQS